jgi:hypothetical protein
VRLVAVNAVLLLLTAGAVVLFGLVARADTAIAGSVRRYAVALSSSNLDAALAEIAPAQREAWRGWISGQLGNVYEVRGVAVRSRSLLQRAWERGDGTPYEVSIVLDVNRDYPTFYFQPTPRVPVEQVDGTWYLSQPPLADRGP